MITIKALPAKTLIYLKKRLEMYLQLKKSLQIPPPPSSSPEEAGRLFRRQDLYLLAAIQKALRPWQMSGKIFT